MHVTHLQLVDFRNYAQADVALQAGPVLFIGRNGQGKTNLVEAIGYVASLSSHRVAIDQPLVRFGADRAIVRAAVVRDAARRLVVLDEVNHIPHVERPDLVVEAFMDFLPRPGLAEGDLTASTRPVERAGEVAD